MDVGRQPGGVIYVSGKGRVRTLQRKLNVSSTSPAFPSHPLSFANRSGTFGLGNHLISILEGKLYNDGR